VLTGRDRSVRQHIREVRIATVWVLEDWNFEWTVEIDHGKLRFERRPPRAPDVTLTWPSADDFFRNIGEGRTPDTHLAIEGSVAHRGYVDIVYRGFCRQLEQVIKYPFDDAGNPLL